MLRAVGGLTTREIAEGFFVPEATMAQRISRAKSTLRQAGARLEQPPPSALPSRLLAVRHAISLLYTQAHAVADGVSSADSVLARTALRLARELHRLAQADPENAGLLALLLLTHARSRSRLDAAGDLVPLEEQDRRVWDQALIAEGISLIEHALPVGYVGSFQLQAAIAAVHAEAADHASTDWPQILALYQMLEQVDPTPAAILGRAIATAEVNGPHAGLEVLERLPDMNHRAHAARGHMLARANRKDEARTEFIRAAELARSIPEQRYLNKLAAGL
jgi:predicted RNA polymerase sigma factor